MVPQEGLFVPRNQILTVAVVKQRVIVDWIIIVKVPHVGFACSNTHAFAALAFLAAAKTPDLGVHCQLVVVLKPILVEVKEVGSVVVKDPVVLDVHIIKGVKLEVGLSVKQIAQLLVHFKNKSIGVI